MKIIKIDLSNLDEIFKLIKKCSDKLESEGYYHWNRYKKESIREKIENTNCYGMQIENDIIGFVSVHKKEQSFMNDKNKNYFTGNTYFIYFSTLAILPEYQNKGYAGKLIDFLIINLKKEGIKHIRMAYISDNDKLNKFYQNKGFNSVYKGYVEEVNNNVTFGELNI